jgi:DNA repair ATPase RecN
MDDNPATTSGPNTISSESPEVIEKHAFASEASNDIDELAKKCDDFYENPEKFLNDIETEMKTILESFDQLFGLATKYLKQSLQFQDVSRQLQTEIKSLKSDLQDAYQMREIHVKEMSSLVATIQSLQKDRDQVVKQYHQEFVNRNDLERLQYDVSRTYCSILLMNF